MSEKAAVGQFLQSACFAGGPSRKLIAQLVLCAWSMWRQTRRGTDGQVIGGRSVSPGSRCMPDSVEENGPGV